MPEPPLKKRVESVNVNSEFCFTAKLFQSFTHTRKPAPLDEKEFKDGIAPLMENGRLGALLMQFPWSLKNDSDSRSYLLQLVRLFRGYPLVLEVRHSSWMEDTILDLLAELDVGICNIDQPLFQRSIQPATRVTSEIGYVRLHGRNYKQWFSPTPNVRDRYAHLYSVEELEPWVDRIRKISKNAKETYVMSNNHNIGKGPTNALEIALMLSGREVDAPATLIKAYPRLGDLTKSSSPQVDAFAFPDR